MTRNVRLAIGFAVVLLGTLILAIGYTPSGATSFDSGLFSFCSGGHDESSSDLMNVPVVISAGLAMLAGVGFIISCFFGSDEEPVA